MPNEYNSTGEIICSVVRSDPVQFEFKTNPRLVSKRLGGGMARLLRRGFSSNLLRFLLISFFYSSRDYTSITDAFFVK